ncbi:Aldo-keto reductase [Operophtera brumata]|uniref:Aldo-keto reductase n=1 Tax=Operophtera brumata TaxID=104452 RepID=A0A0L7LJ80_OPEBR|nr:Aldo-keto reductase [Operophtera brumata]
MSLIIAAETFNSQPGEVTQAVKDAIDVGYRHIDCAHIYLNEPEVGAALTEKFSQGVVKSKLPMLFSVDREDIFITSKLWCTFHHPDLVEGALKTTLKNLGLEYLDLYLIHWPQAYKARDDLFPKDAEDKVIPSPVDIVDTWKAMEPLVAKGLVRSIGLSNFNKQQIERVLAAAAVKPVVLQKLFDYCKAQDIAVTAYSPLGSPDRPWAKPSDPQLMEDPSLKEIADKYAIDRGMIVIPKSVNRTRIAQNFNVFDFQLTMEDMKQVASLECGGRLCSMGDTHHPEFPFHEEF